MDTSRQMLPFIALATFAWAQSSVTWQQAGGSFQSTSALKGIVGQGYGTPVATAPSGEIRSGFLAHPLLVNNGPFVVSGLRDLEKPEGFGRISILLDTVFSDIDGDTLTYSVADSGTAAVASIHGDTLLLSGTAGVSGTARIFVLATDGSDTASDTFRVAARSTDALVARPAGVRKSTELSVSIPKALASPAIGTGKGRLEIGSVADGSDGLSVNVLLPGAASVSVSIFDNLGTPVIAVAQDIGAARLRGLDRTSDSRWILPVSWNLRASDGAAVPVGVYLWKIGVVAADGQKLETVRRLGVKGAMR